MKKYLLLFLLCACSNKQTFYIENQQNHQNKGELIINSTIIFNRLVGCDSVTFADKNNSQNTIKIVPESEIAKIAKDNLAEGLTSFERNSATVYLPEEINQLSRNI